MPLVLCVFSVGVFGVGLLSALPSPVLLLALSPVALACLFVRRFKLVFVLFAGVCWGTGYGWFLLDQQLRVEHELQDFIVRGEVVGLPASDKLRQRFELKVEKANLLQDGSEVPLQRLRLSWYQGAPEIKPGQTWRLRVSLRRPRGFANPGGFHYRLWLLRQGVSATGYVRSSDDNMLLAERWRWPDSLRYELRLAIDRITASERAKGLLKALAISDSGGMSANDWQLLNRTGTTHLLVISGLHVGLFAWVCYWLGLGLGRLIVLWRPQLPANCFAVFIAIAGALFYASLAGFGLPVTRALIMVAVVMAVQCLRTTISLFSAVGIAVAAIAITDPLAIHAGGFWLSFGAVVALLWVFGYRRGSFPWWQKLWLPQWTVFVALPGFLLLFFGRFSLLSPLTNILAIPWVSFLVVPLGLTGVVMLPLSSAMANQCWQIAAWLLDVLWEALLWLEKSSLLLQLSGSVPVSPLLIVVVSLGGLVLLLPRGMPARWLGCIPVLALMLAEPERPRLTISVLDVGQGLAVVVSTQHHTMVYDTGAGFSKRFDAGSGVIAPYLYANGITRINRVVVSHRDNDHAGGLHGLLGVMPTDDIMAGEPLPLVGQATMCKSGMRWHWDGVDFTILSPTPENSWRRNNRSCVLLISAGKHRVLLPGDIESDIERWLVTGGHLPGGVDVLIAPHHGSKTSSSPTFAWHLEPRHVVYSAGYRHSFGHPHADVVTRYHAIGSRQWNTAGDGAVELVLGDGQWEVSGYRHKRHFYWH